MPCVAPGVKIKRPTGSWNADPKKFKVVSSPIVPYNIKRMRNSATFGLQYKRLILAKVFVRMHMFLILLAVTMSGFLISRILYHVGVKTITLRYPVTVAGAYGFFFLAVRFWISQIVRKGRSHRVSQANYQSSNFNSSSTFRWPDRLDGDLLSKPSNLPRFNSDGGRSGGAGASSNWSTGEGGPTAISQQMTDVVTPSPDLKADTSFSVPSGGRIELDKDAFVIIAFALLIAAISGAGFYLIYAAPSILPDAAFQLALSSGLWRSYRHRPQEGWEVTLFKGTCIPFFIVGFFAWLLAYAAITDCPKIVQIGDFFSDACRSRTISMREKSQR